MKACIIFFTAFFYANLAFSYNLDDARIYNECANNKLFLDKEKNFKVDCNDLYHLYLSSVSKRNTSRKMKIAGYNIYKLGNRETKFKDYEINAHIMSAWDVVAVTELVPSQGMNAFNNDSLDVLKNFDIENSGLSKTKLKNYLVKKYKDQYKFPGYLKLLMLLRQIDPDSGWSLVLSPYLQSKSYELSGFYFRSSVASLQDTSYCNHTREYLKKEGAVQTYKYVENELVYETVRAKLPGIYTGLYIFSVLRDYNPRSDLIIF